MPKLVVMVGGQVLSEWQLGADDVIIGRGSDCEVHLEDPAVSRHHAKVMRIHTAYFIEDLNSTNGVSLNGQRVRKHMLKGGDVLQVGAHELRYTAEEQDGADLDKTVVLTPGAFAGAVAPAAPTPAPAIPTPAPTIPPPAAARPAVAPRPAPAPRPKRTDPSPTVPARAAYVRYLNGPERGDSRLIDKSLYTIGQPGGNLAVISRRVQGHFLLHLGGPVVTMLNGQQVHGAGVKLSHGDHIRVGDMELEFSSE